MNIKHQLLSNHFLALSIGIVYFWFGILKFFPELSPAEELASNTISLLTFNLIPSSISINLLAIWESLIGLFLILNLFRQSIIIITLVHMVFTFTPLFFFPDLGFVNAPFQFTLLGQYIFKNIIIIGALLTLYKMPKTKSKVIQNSI